MRPHGRAAVNPQSPEAFARCDRCGGWFNSSGLVWQFEWAGTHLYNTGNLVCKERCLDVPQEQLRTIVLPPDPMPVENARTEDFLYDNQTPMILQFGGLPQPPWGSGPAMIMCDQTGEIPLVLQYLTSS